MSTTKTQPADRISALDTAKIFYQASIKQKRLVLPSLLHPVGAILIGVAVPFYAGKVLAGIAQQDADVTPSLILLGVSSFLGVLANRAGFMSIMSLQASALSDLHKRVFERLLRRSVGFHSDRVSGKLTSDAIDFITSYSGLLTAFFINGLAFVVTVVFGLVVVFINSWKLGLALSVVIAIIIAWTAIESRRRSTLRLKRLTASKKLTSHLSDNIVNVQTVKTFAGENLEIARNAELNEDLKNLRLKDWRRAARSGSNRIGSLLLMQFIVISLVVYLERKDPTILATGIFVFTYMFTLTNRLFEINALTRQIEEALLNASPTVAMLGEDIEINDAPNATELKVTKGKITLNDLSFAYSDKQNHAKVFDGLSLEIKPGERIGLVGPSGGGKSTLTRLLLRFDDINDGSIQIDDQDICQVKQTSLRKSIAYVPQEPLLFHRSIRENIAYGKSDADERAIITAAKQANAHDFIQSLPNGYETTVGERGVKLSGGQRQRVAIARALLKNAPILVLDEATSALDSESEVLIQDALWKLMEGRTAVVIAHRLSTIQKMDRIIVLEDGKITEEGSHKELIKKNGTYARLWAHQSGGFIEEQ